MRYKEIIHLKFLLGQEDGEAKVPARTLLALAAGEVGGKPLHPSAIRLVLALWARAGLAWPEATEEELREVTGLDRRSVRRAMGDLLEVGLVERGRVGYRVRAEGEPVPQPEHRLPDPVHRMSPPVHRMSGPVHPVSPSVHPVPAFPGSPKAEEGSEKQRMLPPVHPMPGDEHPMSVKRHRMSVFAQALPYIEEEDLPFSSSPLREDREKDLLPPPLREEEEVKEEEEGKELSFEGKEWEDTKAKTPRGEKRLEKPPKGKEGESETRMAPRGKNTSREDTKASGRDAQETKDEVRVVSLSRSPLASEEARESSSLAEAQGGLSVDAQGGFREIPTLEPPYMRRRPPAPAALPGGMVRALREAGLWGRLRALARYARDEAAFRAWALETLAPLWEGNPEGFPQALAQALEDLAKRPEVRYPLSYLAKAAKNRLLEVPAPSPAPGREDPVPPVAETADEGLPPLSPEEIAQAQALLKKEASGAHLSPYERAMLKAYRVRLAHTPKEVLAGVGGAL